MRLQFASDLVEALLVRWPARQLVEQFFGQPERSRFITGEQVQSCRIDTWVIGFLVACASRVDIDRLISVCRSGECVLASAARICEGRILQQPRLQRCKVETERCRQGVRRKRIEAE